MVGHFSEKVKPKVRRLSQKEVEILVECFYDIYCEGADWGAFQEVADNLYENLTTKTEVWIAIGAGRMGI